MYKSLLTTIFIRFNYLIRRTLCTNHFITRLSLPENAFFATCLITLITIRIGLDNTSHRIRNKSTAISMIESVEGFLIFIDLIFCNYKRTRQRSTRRYVSKYCSSCVVSFFTFCIKKFI